MNGWSAYCLWRGAAAAGEARERPDRQCALQGLWNLKHGGGQLSGRSYRREEKEKVASDLSDSASSAESESCGWGQSSNCSYRRGREEQRKKGLNWQTLPGAPRAACSAPCSLFLAASKSAWQPSAPGHSRPTICSLLNQRAWLLE
ncbi:uncharacterized protein VSU04_008976 isoform 2-T2 [Chlamydotis macqueenii]